MSSATTQRYKKTARLVGEQQLIHAPSNIP